MAKEMEEAIDSLVSLAEGKKKPAPLYNQGSRHY